MIDAKADVEEQWKQWQDENPPSSFVDIHESVLKEQVINDLTYVSKMDVKEYTLYQKWCEIKEKYPTVINQTLFGEEVQLVDPNQQKVVDEIKASIWVPQSAEDYLNLQPVLEYTDDSGKDMQIGIDGKEFEVEKKRSKDLPERWNTVRNFISTMKNNSNIGRNLNFLVRDQVTGKYLGVICISSDFLDLTPRDEKIGWARELKTQGSMINHTAIGSTIVPFQPLGYNYVGGKLLALLCLSDEVQRLWKKQYGDVLIGVTTTSLYGRTKADGLSQYDNLDHWQKMGFTAGSVSFEPSRKVRGNIINWLKTNHTRNYFEWYVAKKPSGQPHKRDHKNRSLQFTYSKLQVPKELIKTAHARGIYWCPLYDKTVEFLRAEDTTGMKKNFDTSIESLVEVWKKDLAKPRISILKKKDKVSHETLFYDDLITLTWQETKDKYLGQVGR